MKRLNVFLVSLSLVLALAVPSALASDTHSGIAPPPAGGGGGNIVWPGTGDLGLPGLLSFVLSLRMIPLI